MRQFLHPILTIAGYALTFIGALLLILWAMRGVRPALECGLLVAVQAQDWAAAYACLDLADYDPLIGVVTIAAGLLAWLASRLTNGSKSGEYDPSSEERSRNRVALANRVQKTWIDGVLNKSLYKAVLIALGWQPSPESIEVRPWSMKAGRPDEAGTLVPPTAGIAALFDQSEGALLILGEPGSGKTTMLLDLTRTLLARRTPDSIQPVPMVFNLSSWQGKEQSIADWLVSELRRFYDVPEKIARHLVDHGELALMLDGLDEVRAEMRNECVAAVNAYRSERIVPVALCCRVAEYGELKTKLVAHLAVTLQPLTPEQQSEYLENLALPEADKLQTALQADDALREVAGSPLMLSVMLGAGVYLRLDEAGLTPDGLRSAIWDAYLQNMLSRERKTQAHYPVQQVVRQLSWLAEKMVQRSQTVFLVEWLDIDMLSGRRQQLVYMLSISLFLLLLSLPAGPISLIYLWSSLLQRNLVQDDMTVLLTGKDIGLPTIGFMVVLGVVTFVIVIVIGRGLAKLPIKLREDIITRNSPRGYLYLLLGGLIAWLLLWLSGGMTIWVENWLNAWAFSLTPRSSSEPTSFLVGATKGAVIGLPLLLKAGVPSLVWALWLVFAMYWGLISFTTSIDKHYPNSRPSAVVRRILGRSLGAAIGLGVVVGTFEWQLGEFLYFFTPERILRIYLAFLVGAISFGFFEVARHFALRFSLSLDGAMPLNYVRFLDYCTDRILLRKVGGGYIFIHRTFMEHMAQIDVDRFVQSLGEAKSK